MSSKKIIVVTGATGAQGGSVARFLLDDGTYAVRAVTRNPDSPAAKELASKGAEVVKADSRELASLEKAFKGAYGVFAVTNYWEPGVGADGEISQGKLLVDAAKATGIKHYVWSTLDSTPHKASHWESKDQVDQYLKKSGVPRTSLYTTFFFENFVGMLRLQKRAQDGSYDFPLPLPADEKLPVYSVADTGGFVLAAFLHPETWLGKDMRISTEFLTTRELSKTMSDVSGKTVHIQEIDMKGYEALKGKGIPDEFHSNFMALYTSTSPSFRDTALSRKLHPGIKTFREWAQENATKIFPE